MPNWKKVITSGSNAHLNHITASGNISSSGNIKLNKLLVDNGNFVQFSDNDNFYIGGLSLAADNGQLTFNAGNSSNNVMEIHNNGSNQAVGIGKTFGVNLPPSTLTVEGDISASGNLEIDGNVTIDGDILPKIVQMTNSSSVIDTFNTGSHQTCKYVLQVTSASFIQSSEMLVMQSGSNAFNTEYAQMGTDVNLGSFSTSVSDSNVKLNFAGDFISCSVKFNRTLI